MKDSPDDLGHNSTAAAGKPYSRLSPDPGIPTGPRQLPRFRPDPNARLLDPYREVIRFHHLSHRTELSARPKTQLPRDHASRRSMMRIIAA